MGVVRHGGTGPAIVGLIGAGIAVAVQAVSLTLLASHAPLHHRPGTGH